MKKIVLLGIACIIMFATSVFAAFMDVNKEDIYYKEIDYAESCGIFNGESADIFAPNKNMTRAMITQVIYNLEKNPEFTKSQYDDVKETDWFFDAVSWGTDKGIIEGMGNNKFEPNSIITKEQAVTVLYNYAKYKEYDVSIGEETNILSYEDAFSLHEYGYAPMQWGLATGIIKGENGLLNHDKPLTRAEVADIMKTFSQRYVYECGWIRLDGNITTGYVWNVKSYNKNIVFVDDYKYYEGVEDELLVGAPGVFEFMVTALKEGKTEIVFEYMRSWEKEPVRTVTCDVIVEANGELDILLKSDV